MNAIGIVAVSFAVTLTGVLGGAMVGSYTDAAQAADETPIHERAMVRGERGLTALGVVDMVTAGRKMKPNASPQPPKLKPNRGPIGGALIDCRPRKLQSQPDVATHRGGGTEIGVVWECGAAP